MTDERGTFEHADFDEPRPEHGYCTDDMARVLVVAAGSRNPIARGAPPRRRSALRSCATPRTSAATAATGWTERPLGGPPRRWTTAGDGASGGSAPPRPRRTTTGSVEWRTGRARASRAAALAVAAGDGVRGARCGRGAGRRLPTTVTAHAAPDRRRRPVMPADAGDAEWPWPEPRLTYANAVAPRGDDRRRRPRSTDPTLVSAGLELLDWLLDHETPDGHLSVTPVGGSGPGDAGPASTSSRSRWRPWPMPAPAPRRRRRRALGRRGRPGRRVVPRRQRRRVVDVGSRHRRRLRRPAERGANLNQGAESTLALLSTLQHARRARRVLR